MNRNKVNEDNCGPTNMLVQANCIANYVSHISILQCAKLLRMCNQKKPRARRTKNHTRRDRPNLSTFYLQTVRVVLRKCSKIVAQRCLFALVFIVKGIIRMGGRVDCPVQSNKIIWRNCVCSIRLFFVSRPCFIDSKLDSV